MKNNMKQALLRSYDLRRQAGEIQVEKGIVDVGLRSQVTSGKHMDEIASLISKALVEMGVDEKSVHYNKKDVEIPGWFRATKQWDILAFKDDQLITGIELKSISGSYGNNLNNRTEEAIGEAIDAKYASDRGLLNRITPPLMAYALIVKKDVGSMSVCKKPKSHYFRFYNISCGIGQRSRLITTCSCRGRTLSFRDASPSRNLSPIPWTAAPCR